MAQSPYFQLILFNKNVILFLVIYMNLKCWQKNLDDNTQVLCLNMAGTHDCVTQYVQFSHMARCQNKSIFEQLCMGIRGLDIRVEQRGDRLGMVHGFAKAFNTKNHFGRQMDMADVLEQCYDFLDENPRECIVFQFKNDNGRQMEQCFDNLMNTYIRGSEDRWFLENRSPLLYEARGKIILIRRCKMANRAEYSDKNTGIDFSSWQEQDEAVPQPLSLCTGGKAAMNFIIQDRYKYKPVPRWHKCIKPFLDTMEPFKGSYIINYLSTAGGLKGPYNNSKYINPRFLNYRLRDGVYYGMIYMDFPTEEIVEKIVKTNFVI